MEDKEIIFALKNLKSIKPEKSFVKKTQKEIFGEIFSPIFIFPISSLSIAFLLLCLTLFQLPNNIDFVQNQIIEIAKIPIEKPGKNLAKKEEIKKEIKTFAQKPKLEKEELKKILEIGKEKEEVEKKLGVKIFDTEEKELEKIYERHAKILLSDVKKQAENSTSIEIQTLLTEMEKSFEEGNFQKVIELYLNYQKQNEE